MWSGDVVNREVAGLTSSAILQGKAARAVQSSTTREREHFLKDVYDACAHIEGQHRHNVAFIASGVLLTQALQGTAQRIPHPRKGGRRHIRLGPTYTRAECDADLATLGVTFNAKETTCWDIHEGLKTQLALHPIESYPWQRYRILYAYVRLGCEWGMEAVKKMLPGVRAAAQEYLDRMTMNTGIAGLILAGVIGAAVYFLYWRPRRKQRQADKQQLAEEQARLVQEIQKGTAVAAGVADTLPGALKEVAAVGLAEARRTEAALQLPNPTETTSALAGVVEWSRRQLQRVWQGFKNAFTHAVNVTTRLARRVWPSRFSNTEPVARHGEDVVVAPVHAPAPEHANQVEQTQEGLHDARDAPADAPAVAATDAAPSQAMPPAPTVLVRPHVAAPLPVMRPASAAFRPRRVTAGRTTGVSTRVAKRAPRRGTVQSKQSKQAKQAKQSKQSGRLRPMQIRPRVQESRRRPSTTRSPFHRRKASATRK
jgi:hypothetical protein